MPPPGSAVLGGGGAANPALGAPQPSGFRPYNVQPPPTVGPRPTAGPRIPRLPLPITSAASRVPNAVQAAAAGGRGVVGALGGPVGIAATVGPAVYGAQNAAFDKLFPQFADDRRRLQDAAALAGANPFGMGELANNPYNPLNPFGKLWDWAPWNIPSTPTDPNPASLKPKPTDGGKPWGENPPSGPQVPPAGYGIRFWSTNNNRFVQVGGDGYELTSFNVTPEPGPFKGIIAYSFTIPTGEAISGTTNIDPATLTFYNAGQEIIPRFPEQPIEDYPGRVPGSGGDNGPALYEPNKPEYPKKDEPAKAPPATPPTLPFIPGIPARAPSPTPGLPQPNAPVPPTDPTSTPQSAPAPAARPSPTVPAKLPPLNQNPGISPGRIPAEVTDKFKQPQSTAKGPLTNQDLSTQIQQLSDEVENKTRLGCRYEEDDLATVPIRVYTGENLLTGPQYGVKSIQIHEKMTEFATEHFNHLSEIRGQADGLRGRIKKVLDRLQIMRILNLMSTIASLHNAAMLSRNLGQTLGDATSTVITAVGRTTGFMSAEESIDVNQIIGEAFDDYMKSALGETVWNGTKESWKKANRILSAASQIMWTIRSINDSRREMLEWIGENTGKIGNALKKYGVVGERAYNWMPEKFNLQTRWEQRITKFREGTENIDDAASSLESVASETINIQDEFLQLKEQRETFENLLTTAETKARPDNTPAKTVADTAKSISQGLDLTPADMEPPTDATP
jgi:hypothetical protein